MHHYRIAGLAVASEFELAGCLPAEIPTGAPDVLVRLQSVKGCPSASADPQQNWSVSRETFVWDLPGVGRFAAISGDEMHLDLDAGQSLGDAMPYLLGTTFAALCYQRGEWLLHASAVAVDGRAMLFCGSSGKGKSTTAAALGAMGYPLLSDDLCRIEFSDTGPRVHADGRMLKLYDQTLAKLDLGEHRAGRVLSARDKYYVAPRDDGAAFLPLGGIHALFPVDAAAPPELNRMPPLEACDQLLQRTYRRQFALTLLGGQEILRRSSVLVRHRGVWSLSLPRDLQRLPDCLRWLAERWHAAED